MTARELHPKIGSLVYLQASGLQVACIVSDAKRAYGHERLEVEPVAGSGKRWVSADKVQPVPEDEARRISK